MAKLNGKNVEALRKLVAEAVAGRFPELTRILAAAGYCRGTRVRTLAEVAQGFSVSRDTMKNWLAGGAPGRTPEGYDVMAIARWRNEHLLKQINQPLSADADEELKRVKTERERLKLARERAEVLDARDVERVWRRSFAADKSIILGIPDRILMLLPDELRADMQPVLRDTVDEILGILSRVGHDIEESEPHTWEAADPTAMTEPTSPASGNPKTKLSRRSRPPSGKRSAQPTARTIEASMTSQHHRGADSRVLAFRHPRCATPPATSLARRLLDDLSADDV